MDKIATLVSEYANPKVGGGDSFADRLSCRYTVYLLLLFCLLITTKHYVGEPINCWCPAHFTSSQVDFTNSVCWTTGTYYLPSNRTEIPKVGDTVRMIGYYQWVPLVLVLMAIFFYIPRTFWIILNKATGLAVNVITSAAIDYQTTSDLDKRSQLMNYMSGNQGIILTESIHSPRRHRYNTVRKALFKTSGNYLITAYIITKCLYLLNVVAQFIILDNFLGIKYHGYGLHIIKRIVNGDGWQTSDRFPRVTLCNMWIRVLGSIQRHTVQCSLPMNLMNQIIFIFIWFWLIFVFLATLCSLVKWATIGIHRRRQVDYALARLTVMSMLDNKRETRSEPNESDVKEFVHKFLARDGFLMIRLVSHNTTDLIASELLYKLWNYYLENKETICSIYDQSEQAKAVRNQMLINRQLRNGSAKSQPC